MIFANFAMKCVTIISIIKSQEDLAKLAKQLQGRKASIGVKKLLGLIDMVSQYRANGDQNENLNV